MPLVSVIMPVYNSARYVGMAIQSILEQTLTDLELIIIDDCSDDETQIILANYAADDDRILLVRNERNVGVTPSLNRGLSLARGKYIARQDSDDVSFPRRLEFQVAYLQTHTDVGLLGAAYKEIDRDGIVTRSRRVPQADIEIRWQMLFHNAFCHTAVIFRSSLLVKHQLTYEEAQIRSQDYDLWARMLRYTRGYNLPEELVYLRKHEEGVSAMNYETQQQFSTRVAERQFRQVWPQHPFSSSEIRTLRQWYNRFPQHLTKQDMTLCCSLLTLLANFEKQPMADSDTVAHIKLYWTRRILYASRRLDQWTDFVSSGLLVTILRCCLRFVIFAVPTWLGKKAKHAFRSLSPTDQHEE